MQPIMAKSVQWERLGKTRDTSVPIVLNARVIFRNFIEFLESPAAE